MNIAIGMIEFNSIAKGIEVCDDMVKAANVNLLRASTVCPGKYIVLISGEIGNVKISIDTGKNHAGGNLIDDLIIPNVHESLIPAITMTNEIKNTNGAVGVIEFYSIASAIAAADVAAKAAQIDLIEVRIGYAVGGKGFIVLTGDVSAVRTAVDAASKNVTPLVNTAVISRPSKQLFDSLM